MIPPQYATVIGPEWANQGYYKMDVERVNMTTYPGLVDVPWYKTVLQQGDCLYLPYKWVHQVSPSAIYVILYYYTHAPNCTVYTVHTCTGYLQHVVYI